MREDAQVKLGGFFSVVIEPEEWRKFVHGWHRTRQDVTSDKPTSKDLSMLDCGQLEPSDAELSEVMVDVFVHENGPLLRLERAKERMWVLGAAS